MKGFTIMATDNYFKQLYDIDVRPKTKQKNGLNYLSWAAAWAEVKKIHPDAVYNVYEQIIEYAPNGEDVRKTRPWFDDGKTAWVKVGVTINGLEHKEMLPIMDFKNKPIPAENVTSSDANKSIKRCFTKACALHGLGAYIYEGEDLPEEAKESNSLQTDLMELIKKKSALSEATKIKVAEICKESLVEENGDPRLCDDNDKLKNLKKKLMAVRKVPDKK